jgi:hypothetical protein
MQQTLVTVGLVCIMAAIIGGGLEAFGIKMPLLESKGRKLVLAALGIALLIIAAAPYLTREPTISGKVLDIASNQGISGVRLTLVDKSGSVLQRDIFTSGQDGAFQFILPRGIRKQQLPLRFQLSRPRWAASYIPDEQIIDLSADRLINLPVDLMAVNVAVTSAAIGSPSSTASANLPSNPATVHTRKGDQSSASSSLGASSQGRVVLQTAVLRLVVRQSSEYLDFEFQVRPSDDVMIKFDVNKNNKVDPNTDLGYATTSSGDVCATYLLTARSYTNCGAFATKATVTITQPNSGGAPVKVITWHIPKNEINAMDGDAHFTVGVYNEVTKAWSNFPGEDFASTLRAL